MLQFHCACLSVPMGRAVALVAVIRGSKPVTMTVMTSFQSHFQPSKETTLKIPRLPHRIVLHPHRRGQTRELLRPIGSLDRPEEPATPLCVKKPRKFTP